MPQITRVRLTVVVLGAIVMIGSAIVGFYGSGAIAETWPDAQPAGLQWLAVLFAPLTAMTVLLSGALWTRGLRASMRECVAALAIVEIAAWAIVGYFVGDWFTPFVIPFWVGVNLVFAPWWLLAFWIGNRSDRRHTAALLTGLAVAILIASQVLLPGSPFRTSSSRGALKEATVRNIRDDVLLSAKGNPIGIRVTYEVVFPQAVVASVHLGLSEVEAVPYVQSMQLGGQLDTIDPAPASDGPYALYKRFESDRVYTFTATRMPAFLGYDEKTGQPCLRVRDDPDFSEVAIVSALESRGRGRYRMWVSMSDDRTMTVEHAQSVTSHDYDFNAMYRTIVTEGHRRCSS